MYTAQVNLYFVLILNFQGGKKDGGNLQRQGVVVLYSTFQDLFIFNKQQINSDAGAVRRWLSHRGTNKAVCP